MCVLAGVYYAWSVVWLGDDAFVSFTYARNLARGDGLVFNRGEHVEGYTNTLWVLLLAAAARVGLDIPRVALVLDLIAFVALILGVESLARPWRTNDAWTPAGSGGSGTRTTVLLLRHLGPRDLARAGARGVGRGRVDLEQGTLVRRTAGTRGHGATGLHAARNRALAGSARGKIIGATDHPRMHWSRSRVSRHRQ